MRNIKFVPFLILFFALTSCYHAKITTGETPSAQKIEEPWAHGFILGLVPPKEINTASQCPNGVAMVETKISFLNGLVSIITFNIYTPMHITVTCASGSAMSANSLNEIVIPDNADDETVIEAFDEASRKSAETQSPVFVRFE